MNAKRVIGQLCASHFNNKQLKVPQISSVMACVTSSLLQHF